MMQRRISVTSTGAMGSAVAAAFLSAGHSVTVWNRSAEKALPLASRGARIARSLHEAIEGSDIIVAVPNPYNAAEHYFFEASVARLLKRKTIVLLSSYQSVADPRRLEGAFSALGAAFVDGKIFCYPSQISQPTTLLAFSGPQAGFHDIEGALGSLGSPIYLGREIERAFIFECGMTSLALTTIASATNSLALFLKAGIAAETLEEGARAVFRGLESYLGKVVADMVPNHNFDPKQHDTASVGGMLEVLQHFPGTFGQFGIRTDILGAVMSVMKDMVEYNAGSLDMAAIIKMFQTPFSENVPQSVDIAI